MFPGAFIVGTPGYIVNLDSFPAPQGLGGELFCRLISTQYFVFVFGKVSVLTIVALALERWYSVVKPISYKLKFMRKRIYIYILVIWLLSAITNGSKPLKAQLDETSQHCTWSSISYPKEIFIPCYTTLTFFIPITIIWISFLHVARILKTSLAERESERFRRTRKKLTQMCALVAGLLTICWLPNQIFYTLSAFDITTAETALHHFTIVLAMFNSCVNPLVCCFTNRDYKRAVKRTLCCCRFKLLSRHNTISVNYVMNDLKHAEGVVYGLNFRYLNSSFTCVSEDNSVVAEMWDSR